MQQSLLVKKENHAFQTRVKKEKERYIMSQLSLKKNKKAKRGLSFLLCMGITLTSIAPASVRAENVQRDNQATPGSRVVYTGYDREQGLEVNGEPFFYNGVQIRIDKVADVYGYNDEQIKNLFQTAKDDGFTAANVQMRWTDIQPDTKIAAKEAGYISKQESAQTHQNSIQAGDDKDNTKLGYVKFDVSDLPDKVEAAKIRVYVQAGLNKTHTLYASGLDDDSWSSDKITWDNAPAKELGKENASLPVYDPVKSENYYDIDVTDIYNQRQTKDDTSSFTIQANTVEGESVAIDGMGENQKSPELIVSQNKDEYDWDYLDKVLGWAEEAGIKLELLWFGTDTCSISADNRVPFYVYHDYQKCMADEDKPFLAKQTGDMATAYGIYWYLMCKNDKNMQSQEAASVKAMYNHVAEYNDQNGKKNTVIGCQVANEPNISKLHGGSVTDSDGNKVPHCMCENCLKIKKQMNLSDQGFRDWTMFEYCDNLAKAVKTSNYPVWTRVNNVQGNDAWGVTYNENMRAKGGTDTDEGTYLDFIGIDPYGWGRSNLYGFGTGEYSDRENLPMVMESGGEKSMSALMGLATIAGGGFYNVYDLCSPDGHALYNQDGSPNQVAGGDKYLPNGGTYIEDIRSTNHLLNKIAYELAVKKPDSAGGTDLKFFNCEGTDKTNINVTKQIEGVDVTYQSDTIYSAGIAVKRNNNEIVLESTKDDNAVFTLSHLAASEIESVEYGHYEGMDWVKDDGEVTYEVTGKDIKVTMPAFSCVRVKTVKDMPAPTVFEAEKLDDDGACQVTPTTVTKDNFDDANAHGGGWLKFSNLTEGAAISFDVDVPEDMANASIVTGYKAGSDRGAVQLSVNGKNYGSTIDMKTGSGYTFAAPGEIAELIPGQKNTFTYTVTKAAAQVTVDYIGLTKQDAMPDETEGHVLIDESFDETADNFGFATGTSVENGTLKLTQGMENYTTAVKSFDADIINQSVVDLSFDWKTDVTSDGKKTGLEFRDMYGRLIFAFCGAKGSELRYSTSGPDSDSSQCKWEWEPTWSHVSLDPSKVYSVRLLMDFEQKLLSYSIAEKEGNRVVQNIEIPIEASGLVRMAACNYYTDGATGTQIIDNFKLTGTTEQMDLPLAGKSLYAFGDSIVDGHKYTNASFAEFVALKEGMNLKYNGAVNGAAVVPGDILDQIRKAPEEEPEFVIFDGGVNDAYDTNDSRWGTVGESKNPEEFDTNTFAGNFETMIYEMHQKWPGSKLVYVAAHKLSADRTIERQDTVHNLAMAACSKWGVTVANLYDESELNTREDEYRWNYSFDELGSDGLPGNMNTIMSSDFNDVHPSGTHPNFRGIEKYYVPFVSQALRAASEKTEVDTSILQQLYDENITRVETEYTQASWSIFKTAMDEAKAVLDSTETVQEDVTKALENLQSAIKTLEKKQEVDKSGLKAMISVIEGLNSEDYRASSWNVLMEKLAVAQETVENSNASQQTVTTVYTDLVNAWIALEAALNTSAANPIIQQAEIVLLEADKYRPADIQQVEQALQLVKEAILSEETDQETLDTLTMSLCDALINLREQADAESLQKIADLAAGILQNKDTFTTTSGENLQAAFDHANSVLENEDRTLEEVSEAYQTLTNAIAGLQKRGDKTVMEPLLEKVNVILASPARYVEDTLAGLEEAKEAAQSVYDNVDALQKEINDAAANLAVELAQVRILGDVNSDGKIDTTDTMKILKANAELEALDANATAAADVDKDGIVDTKDAVLVQKYAAEIITEF